MDFTLSEEDQAFAESVRRFAEDKLSGGALQRAHSKDFPWEVSKMLADQGLLGITFPEQDGGQGGTLMQAILAIQEIALACPKSGDIIQAGNFGPIRTFVEYASPEQKTRFLPDLLAGKSVIALAMTEPDAGSAVTELKTALTSDGKCYRLNGSKIFSTNSKEADLFLVYARFGPGTQGIGSVLIERGTPGFQVGEPSTFMNGEEWCHLYFDNALIPPENVLLGPGGFKKQISGFNVERLGNSSRSLALGRYCFNQAREHAQTRQQFGRLLCEFQGIQWKFADMSLQLEAAQLLLYKAAKEGEFGLPSAHSTATAKLACNQAGWLAANESLQIMGGLGFSQELLVEYCLRRIRGWMVAGGSIEMLKNRIAEGIFERRFSQRIHSVNTGTR